MNKRNIDKQDKNIIIKYSKGNEKHKQKIKENITWNKT
jgi:hypothetical protein